MPIPDFQSLMLPVLKALSGGAEMPISEVRARVATSEGLTPEDVRELLPSGKQPVFTNRIAWAVAHMSHAGLVEKVRRGVYRLTAEGEHLLVQAHTRIDLKVLSNYSAYAEWRRGKDTPSEKSDATLTITEDASVTPEEALERAVGELRNELEAEVLERVRKAEPAFLERVVVDLLRAMGYGKGDAAMGQVTGGPGDGGIDGKIREDALGLDEVYLQAKRYTAGNDVGESDLRDLLARLMPRVRPKACLSPHPVLGNPPKPM